MQHSPQQDTAEAKITRFLFWRRTTPARGLLLLRSISLGGPLTTASPQEGKRLAYMEEISEQERIIQESLRQGSFYAVGKALRIILDHQLYINGFPTFAKYCGALWDMAKRTAYQFIAASEVVDNVRSCAQIIPLNEYQARPLARLAPEEQRLAWVFIVNHAPNGKITSKFVNDSVSKLYPKKLRPSNKNKKQHFDIILKKIVIDIASLNNLLNGYLSEKELLREITMILTKSRNLKHNIRISKFGDGICLSIDANILGWKIALTISKNSDQKQNKKNKSHRNNNHYQPKQPEQNDPFKILGVDRNAGANEIKSAHRNLVKMYHPDIYNDMKSKEDRKWIFEEAEERMKKVNWAFDQIKS
jgi:DnaJ-domain-containing protein 1